jgi:hypothetical protein
MRNALLITVGGLAMIAGVVWALQGFNVVAGSFMSGDSVWAVVGPVVALAGLVIAAMGVRGRRSVP